MVDSLSIVTVVRTDLAQEIQTRLAFLQPRVLELHDDSALHVGHAGAAGGGGHYSLVIVSGEFRGKSRVERHQLVYDRLRDLMPHAIHALSIRAFAPEEF